MKYDEEVTSVSWRASTSDEFNNVDRVGVRAVDEGTASFAADAGITRADAFLVTMRYYAMPDAMKALLALQVSRPEKPSMGDFSLAIVRDQKPGRLIVL